MVMFAPRIGKTPMSTARTAAVATAAALAAALLTFAPAGAPAAPPTGYYDTVNASTPTLLRATLHAVIDDHTRFPYTSSSTDTWDILEDADENPANSSAILDLYRNRSYTKFGGGTGPYNREHSWPNSYGFPDDGTSNYPYTDCHHLFLCDVGYNGDRANKPFAACSAGATERVTDFNDGEGGGSGVFPGNSNWYNATYWQTWNGRMGDVARAMFYMDVRYEGGTHGVTGYAEPNLILTDNPSLIVTTGSNASVAYMGLLSVLLQWNAADPVDDRERARNDAVYSYQGNRNPFIDHPEWVNALFLPSTGPAIAALDDVPADQGGSLNVTWQRNSLDAAGSLVPIAQYVVQRYDGAWVDVATQPASQSASYSLAIATADIASPADPQPWSRYRVAAIESGSGIPHLSAVDSAYSVDDLPPPAPVVALDTGGTPWVLSWQMPAIPDFAEACVYRGDAPGFTPGAPLSCGAGTSYDEYDTQLHYYVVWFEDAHGNLGSFSAEVSPDVSDVPDGPPDGVPRTAIARVYPNPFNPLTRIACTLAAPGRARVDVFAADGRHVRALLDEERGAGPFEVLWDGRDERGAPAASGAYFVRLRSGGQADAGRLLLLK